MTYLRKMLSNNKYVKAIYKAYKNTPPIYLDYAIEFKPHWETEGGNPHLTHIIKDNRDLYLKNIVRIAEYKSVVDLIHSDLFPSKFAGTTGLYRRLMAFRLCGQPKMRNRLTWKLAQAIQPCLPKRLFWRAGKEQKLYRLTHIQGRT